MRMREGMGNAVECRASDFFLLQRESDNRLLSPCGSVLTTGGPGMCREARADLASRAMLMQCHTKAPTRTCGALVQENQSRVPS